MCGVMKTFGRSSSGCRSRPGGVPPRPAPRRPARRRPARAASAPSSTSDSRAVLMKNAPGFIRANAAAPNRCRLSAVARACTDTTSDRLSSSSKPTRSPPAGTAAGGDRVVAQHREPERPGAGGHLPADVAQADQAERRAGRLAAEELPALERAIRVLRRRRCRYRADAGTPRISISANAIVSSATASAFLPGVFVTGMPRSVAAATSTLTGPPRAQQTSRSGAASRTSAVTGAPCTTSTSWPRHRGDLGRVARVLAQRCARTRSAAARPRSWRSAAR